MMRRCPVACRGKVIVRRILIVGLFAGVLLCMALLDAGSAEARTLPPHVPIELETDACAICHRAHTAASDITRTVAGRPWETTRTALIVGVYAGAADTQLCFSCHGVDALGSRIDVQSAFMSSSAHSIAPSPSGFGPSPKRCGSCHDSHGSERTAAGDPFPALLSVVASEGSTVTINAGDEFCASCHTVRPGSRWSGIEVWRRTAHSAVMTAPASGTGVICSNCHASHGSAIAPLIRTTLLPPAAPATQTISANNRTLCFVCHAAGRATWPGRTRYEFSGHAMSPATMTIAGEWSSVNSSRTVGECQNCHAPMGRPLSAVQTVPKLLEAPGRALCDSCHSSASPVAAAAADLAQFRFPAAASPKLEVAVAYNAGRNPEVFDRLALYSQETTGPLPFDLVGPREYDLPGVAADMAAGDIRGLGINQLIIADSVARRLAVATPDPLAGVIVSTYSITATPTLVAIGDVLLDGSGRPEVVVVSRSAEAMANSSLWVYRWDAATDTLQEVAGGIALDGGASGVAVGRLTRADRDDIVITAFSGPSISVFTESILSPGTLGTLPVRRYVAADGVLGAPRGPSIGDASAATPGNEIAVANSTEATFGVSVFSPATGLVGSYPHSGAPDARAWDTLIADVLPAIAGAETVVALRNSTGMSAVNVFERHAASGLVTPPLTYDTGLHFGSAALAHGDVDSAADGRLELVVGNAGSWGLARTDNQVPPSIQVFGVNAAGNGLTLPETYSGGGVEKAGNTPSVALVDLGGLGASRHPVSVSRDPAALITAHVSTETAPFELHVECMDCHSAHEATSTPSPAAAVAPEVYGRLKGVWGVRTEFTSTSTITYTQRQGVAYEHEVCFECHSGWNRAAGGPDDVAMQFNIHNPSFHLIAAGTSRAQNTTGSFVTATPIWTTSSVLHCVDCHGNSNPAQPAGPHYSAAAPLLGRPYWGAASSDQTKLCYSCHRYTVYFTGAEDLLPESTSNFRGVTLTEPRLHRLHVNDAGLSCASCHVSHGSRVNEHLIRHGLGWSDSPVGGTCSTQCHLGGVRSYSR